MNAVPLERMIVDVNLPRHDDLVNPPTIETLLHDYWLLWDATCLPRIKCQACGLVGDPSTIPHTSAVEHHFVCPQCGSTVMDTTMVKRKYAAFNAVYPYGSDNTLIVGEKAK